MSIEFVSTVLVPIGLIAIMFSLGLSLTGHDFRRILQSPRPVLIGLSGQLILLPLLAITLVTVLQLPPEMAVGLVVLAACPGGVTSNAIVFAARADVALSVTLTVCSSFVTVFTTPLIISLALYYFYPEGAAPELSILNTIKTLVIITVLPVSSGMLVRYLAKSAAEKMTYWLRPTSMVILVSVIAFSVWVSLDLVLLNLKVSGPAAYLLNILAMVTGYLLARLFMLPNKQVLTVSIEVGVQNATMAAFLTLSILNSLELAIAPTIYGCIMVINSALLIRWFNRKGQLVAT